MIWRLGDNQLDCSRPRVMAIVNATPDSFYSGSRVSTKGMSLEAAVKDLLDARPDIIDIGGQSTRPGSERIDTGEELQRVLPVIEEIRRLNETIPLTVDTYSAQVAKKALAAGADGINDISGGRLDDGLFELVAKSGCGYVLMHMLGTPESMQEKPEYADCVAEVRSFFTKRLAVLDGLGIDRERVVLDPGIGFGKRIEDNLALVTGAGELASLGRPLLYGVSRKSFIGHLTGVADPADRLPGTLGVTWELLNQGVMLHRVHDVREVRQLMDIWGGMHKPGNIVNLEI